MSPATRAALLLASLVLAQPGWTKGVTVRIEIAGPALAEPLAITDPAILERFSIWSGPGYRYAIDPDGSAGHLYLPDSGTRYVFHGVEDNWFRSAPKWEQLVRPLVEDARAGHAGRP